jgi:hydrogenase maturation protease
MKENMQPDVASKTIVVGLGNTIRSDDGAGVHALKRLQLHSCLPDGVMLIDGGTQGIELLTYIYDSSRLLFLDTVDVGEEPGMLVRLSGDELNRLRCGASVHQLGLADLLATLPLVSHNPGEIVLLGVQPACMDWGTELSAPVQAAIDSLVDAAIEQLRVWSQEIAVQQSFR